jgi:DNA modification methylase
VTENAEYRVFLERKVALAQPFGFEIDRADVNPLLFPHQRDAVVWAIAGGRRALFESFGLGKTVQQIEIARIIQSRTGGAALIVLPLGVRHEFMRDGARLGIDFQFIRSHDEMRAGQEFYLTNFESVRLGKVEPARFSVASLDEAAVLRSYGSDTFQEFVPLFASVPYRFVATATPDPNRHKELIHYSHFLGVLDSGQALTRFFQRNSEKAGDLTLYPHKRQEFFLWLASWSLWLQKPSDLGYSDEGYDLPPLDVQYHEVAVDHSGASADRDGQGQMFRNAALSAAQAAREKRATLGDRIEKVRHLVRALRSGEQVVIWVDLNDEQEAIERVLSEEGISYSSLYGSQDIDTREKLLTWWLERRAQAFVSKPVMYGAGVNLQQCHVMIFAGVTFKFYDVAQAVHRIYRFLQREACQVHIVHAESEREIVSSLREKWAQHNEQVAEMSAIIRQYGLGHARMTGALTRSIGIERQEARGEHFLVANNDCVEECRAMDADSVDLVITSIPFSNHYEYTPSYNDFGHTDGDEHFFEQMDFLTPQLLRILKPGRLACIHVKDRILFGSVTGFGTPTVNPFHAKCIFHYQRHGFVYMGMIQVNTDVVRENNQTYRLGWSEQCKDGTKMGVGSPEYILLLRKLPTDRSKAYADEPVRKSKDDYSRARWQIDAHAFWRSSGNRLLRADELAEMGPDKLAKAFTEHSLRQVYDHEEHVRIGEALEARGALPATFMAIAPGSHDPDIWHDVTRMRTLNGEQARRAVELHVCPLQLDVVERLIRRYSNAGETIFDPFGGLMTVPYVAVRMGRFGRGTELNPGYFRDGVRYLREAEVERASPTLFDLLESGERVA